MKVAITGASGLVGRHLAADLHEHGHEAICIDRAVQSELPGRAVSADITDMAQADRALRGADAIVHLARIPFPYTASGYDPNRRTWQKPDHVGDAALFNLNLAMTYNALMTARAGGIGRVVVGSSFAAYGFYYPSRAVLPDYLPIDEAHPLRPDDPYGLTKQLGEVLAEAVASTSRCRIVSLRFPGISRENASSLAARRHDPMQRGIGGFWTYVDARDAATACRLALEADFDGHQAFNICAPTTFMPQPTDELLQRYAPDVPCRRRDSAANWAPYDTSKAQRVLGFQARHLISTAINAAF
jgi:nucleoside-diphosphate-sugar epimerase